MNVNNLSAPLILLNSIEDDLVEYLVTPENLPIHEYERNQEYFPREPDPTSLFSYSNLPISTTLKMQRNPHTGEILEFREVAMETAGSTAKNSMSLTRAPAPPSEATWGSISSFPFWPGGLSSDLTHLESLQIETDKFKTNDLLTVPPGFDRGLIFETDGCTVKTDLSNISTRTMAKSKVVNLIDMLDKNDDFLGLWKTEEKTEKEPVMTQEKLEANIPEEDEVLPKEPPILKISKYSSSQFVQGTEWVTLLDTTIPVIDFHKRIPEMALEYEFELDTFQKLAILQLEQHNHVFVAAHTSAGKTVVAEYAIALSQKHMTRTIYTSPIKALSNQKYRDFKQKFNDVGLVTGDFQINIKAACLIMTTEILRSMLYGGSEVTRDLEYVIFDEVHYINDKDRGHVWEQVLIMLPAHVCVVLLSATVPNTVEFADWLGRTYKKKVYVVTTYKRPVPLQHYLYTGTAGATAARDRQFLILDGDGNFNIGEYNNAKDSLLKVKEKTLPPKTFYGQKQGKILQCLVDHLKRQDLLPVVVFTFSRKLCDENANSLSKLDLTTESEKNYIHRFFNECIKSLKESDRNLPQIILMQKRLTNGIGVHHSGILPIIKEMIEMLFQKQLVKILFATETFAMGVNMPARTVIFDSISKHDGHEKRNLLPAEYIQMAGRAGRRGLDETGTVIILCKGNLPPLIELQKMMLGKPSILKSQFRITYAMVLTLLRVQSQGISVEGVISRSFLEVDYQKRTKDQHIRAKLEEVKNELTEKLSEYMQPLVKFYNAASSYLKEREDVLPDIMKSPHILKHLTPGRILLITHKSHVNKLAILLSTKSNKITYSVLVLKDSSPKNHPNIKEETSDLWYKMLALSRDAIFSPEGAPESEILTINANDIFEITSKIIKVNAELVIKDWEKRQMERFKYDPPGQSFTFAIQELLRVTFNTADKTNGHERALYWDLLTDLKVNELRLSQSILNLNNMKDLLVDYTSSTQIPNFEEQFLIVFNRKWLEDRKRLLEFQLSFASMSLYADYQNRINLLKHLNYVNSQNRVELKGKVACEMGMNELLITELVLRNILADLEPAEVAALLSALVFQAKTAAEQELTEKLKQGKQAIIDVCKEIDDLERLYEVGREAGSTSTLNFGLVNVVYKWSQGTPFASIMSLTDVQEGIIVRCIQQLNELLCDVRSVARLTGDPKLYSKMDEASNAIKRDIVFAASLYTRNRHL